MTNFSVWQPSIYQRYLKNRKACWESLHASLTEARKSRDAMLTNRSRARWKALAQRDIKLEIREWPNHNVIVDEAIASMRPGEVDPGGLSERVEEARPSSAKGEDLVALTLPVNEAEE